jgi:hypothetical protein
MCLGVARLRVAFLGVACLGVPLALAGCSGPSPDLFAPICPKPTIMADLADLDIYRPGSSGDASDLAYSVRVTALNGTCSPGKVRETTNATASLSISVNRGPAGLARQLTVPYMIAVVKDGEVLDKKVFAIDAQFSANTGTVALATPPVELVLPTPKGVSSGDYRIVGGLNLSPAQAQANRAARAAQRH